MSLFDCQRTILLSTKRRNFNSQFGVENSSYEPTSIGNPLIANRQCPGGGEGIRTPDPRVANAVLCQLSYTPDKFEISELKSEISEIGCGGGI